MSEMTLQQLLPPILFMVAMLVMFWLLIIRPAKKKQDHHDSLIKSVENGDKIVTVGGIYGTITKVRDKTIDLKVSEGAIITMDRRAVRRRQDEEDA